MPGSVYVTVTNETDRPSLGTLVTLTSDAGAYEGQRVTDEEGKAVFHDTSIGSHSVIIERYTDENRTVLESKVTVKLYIKHEELEYVDVQLQKGVLDTIDRATQERDWANFSNTFSFISKIVGSIFAVIGAIMSLIRFSFKFS